jgi:hypothetical protein
MQDQKRSDNDFPIEHTVFVVFGSDMFFLTKFLLRICGTYSFKQVFDWVQK